MKKPAMERIGEGAARPVSAAGRGRREVYFAGQKQNANVYSRDALLAGNRVDGPALIEEYASTTVVMPGDRLEVDPFGNLRITVEGTQP
jgi:N-methylhydantoinase A